MIEITLTHGEWDSHFEQVRFGKMTKIMLPAVPRKDDMIFFNNKDHRVMDVFWFANDESVHVVAAHGFYTTNVRMAHD